MYPGFENAETRSRIRWFIVTSVGVLSVLLVTFYAHKTLQRFYFENCSSDIIQILFFKNSDFCVILKNIIRLIEGNYQELFKSLVSRIMWLP